MSLPKINSYTIAGLLFGLSLLPLRAVPATGTIFPKLAQSQLEGTLPETENRVLLVDFWASWCAPCKASFPALDQLQADYGPRGVVIVGVSVDEKASAYTAFLKQHAPKFTTVRDQAHKLVSAVKVPAMPTSFVIGRDGRIRAVFAGYHGEQTEKAVRTALEQALAERSAP
jgi:thiol-disulfide isomerase/thioredoxin